MTDDYGDRVVKSYKAQIDCFWDLLRVAERISPGTWVLQIEADIDPERYPHPDSHRFRAVVSNGDDNVTAIGKTPGAAVALLIHYLLEGAVFPLTGEGGRYIVPDFEDTPAGKQYYAFRALCKRDELSAQELREHMKKILSGETGDED